MSTIAAAELKRRGVSALHGLLKDDDAAIITVRGKREYIVLKAESYDRLRDNELDLALREAQADYKAGRIADRSIKAHLKRIDANV